MNEKYPLALPEGTVLAGQYIVEKVLGQGGFGITYEAKDHKTGRRVAVKEFFPDAMATRTDQTTVMPFSGEKGENYVYGKTCFLQEAETLAKFIGNENIVRIHSYFEEYGTAYFVMDFIEGTSFDAYLKQKGGKIPYEEAAEILIPVMDALSAVHSKGIVHRDVTPDNIYITNEGVVKLLDFGAARYSLGDQSRSLDIILKHGFAPKEQYTRRGKQGPYTDIYALGATFYFALTGKRPPDSVERMDEDELIPPSSLGVQLSGPAEDAILKALSVQPADRFQDMTAFKAALLNAQPSLAAAGGQPAVVQTYFTAPDQTGISHTGTTGGPAPAAGQNSDLQDLASTMKTAGKLASRLAGRMAGKMAEKTAETAGIMAGTAGKMSEIMAAKKAETAEKLAAKMAEREAEKAARLEAEREAAEAARLAAEEAAAEAARRAAEEAAQQPATDEVGRTFEGAGAAPAQTLDEDAVGKTVGAAMTAGASGTPAASTPVKRGMNKKILIPAAAVAVILVGALAFKLKGTDQDPAAKPNPGASTQTSASQGEPSNPDKSVVPDQSTTPDQSTAPNQSPPPESTANLSGNWAVLGNTAANLVNNGIRIEGYSIQDDGYSVWDIENKKYIFEDDGHNSDLSFVDGMLHFLHDNRAYAYNAKEDQLYRITYLNDKFEGKIYRLMLTEDFYIICCLNNAGSYTVYRVLRSNGEMKECCTIPDYNCFTLSDDGWIYYVSKLEDQTSSVFRMRLDTLEQDSATLLHAQGSDYTFCNLIVAGDYLYAFHYDTATFKNYNIIRINRHSYYVDSDPIWRISTELNLPVSENGFGFNVNQNNHIIYLYATTISDDGEYTPNLYTVEGRSDGTFEITRISQNSGIPNILYNSDGTYRLYYLHAEEDDETYGLYYRNYDAEGIYIKNN